MSIASKFILFKVAKRAFSAFRNKKGGKPRTQTAATRRPGAQRATHTDR